MASIIKGVAAFRGATPRGVGMETNTLGRMGSLV